MKWGFRIYLTVLFYAANLVNGEDLHMLKIKSPDNSIEVIVNINDKITYTVDVDGKRTINPSQILLNINEGQMLGFNSQVFKVYRRTVKQEIKPIVPEKFSIIKDHFNEMEILFNGNYSIIFRAYDNGVAYRFKTYLEDEITVKSEQVSFNFNNNAHVFFPQEENFFSHNERTYNFKLLNTVPVGDFASLPVLIFDNGLNILIAESSLQNYPGLWLESGGNNSLNGIFPHYPIESFLLPDSDRNMPVTKYADYIAKTQGDREFPWRILAIARNDGQLITNQLVYQLAEPLQIEDPSWIQPGKVAWDWWNANNLHGVDFRAGINMETYKYYIDFAAKFGIEYIILDEGWSELGNVLKPIPEINPQELIEYAKTKNVKVFLWVIWKTLEDQLVAALDQYAQWGAAGIKVDFMQRDDQEMVEYYWKVAAQAAGRKLLVDFHGAYKPAGLRRAYPNVITREGVKGLEYNKWGKDITPTHNLTIPFIRMVAGPMDYTPGAMINAQPENFRSIFNRPMSMGTRAHQIAMYVIYESPLQMLADSPSNYLKEHECTDFISRIPTTWDETKVIEARIAQYLILARRKGSTWYIGAMTSEAPRLFTLNLSFLAEGQHTIEIIEDGVNADRYGSDYRKTTKSISKNEPLQIKLAPSGGWAAIITPFDN